ncbi:hypothetical protein [Clostridium manihotivorum]|uniref:Uncharacterized protein n=1 Tax=Clostridium manihotivorum TaxID=2320868 RepID=A0A410DTV5_9CLOT|nr:hypothetical protein [Clostridium manihotivorum]QAA32481.1 hypothetical protein C1I91_12985 [Clostridium manihotivorum]
MKVKNWYKVNKVKSKIPFVLFPILFALGLLLPKVMNLFGGFKAKFIGAVMTYTFSAIVLFCLGSYYCVLHKAEGYKYSSRISVRTVGIIFLLLTAYIGVAVLPKYYKDLSRVVKSEYVSYDGELTELSISDDRTTFTKFTLGKKKFVMNKNLSDKNFFVKGKSYHVEMLPNTDFVVQVYRY